MTKHIEIAKQVVLNAGIVAEFLGYSDAHGISVYFTTEDGTKVRVSTHSVTNIDRIMNEIHLSYPLPTLPTPNNKYFQKR
jgi:hypothetical protein